jgi:predicted ArsR family transcriptional regulator
MEKRLEFKCLQEFTQAGVPMKAAIEPGDRQFLQRLHEIGGGTVQEICADLGVTATAVRQRLVRLQGLEMVARELVRAGRGRPHHVYRVTQSGFCELGDNYAELAQILWREMNKIEEPAVRARVVSRIEDALVEQFGKLSSKAPLSDRMTQMTSALRERGFQVEMDKTGQLPILRENSCPYYELASEDPAICELEQAVFRRVLGADVKLTQCCLDGHHCCEFQAVESEAPAATVG